MTARSNTVFRDILTACAILSPLAVGVGVALHLHEPSAGIAGDEAAAVPVTIAADPAGDAPETAAADPEQAGDAIPAEVMHRASLDWGYVPRGGLPEEIAEAALSGRLHHEDVLVLDGAVLDIPDGVFRLHGVIAPSAEDVCENADGDAFDCVAWASEGLDLLVRSGSLRCTPEGIAEAVRCEVQIGGEWTDISAWAVQTGLMRADPRGPHAALQRLARQDRLGIWGGTFRLASSHDEDPILGLPSVQ